MIYKEYGKTGIKVSAIGFGGMRFTEQDYKNGNFDNGAELVKAAFDMGINYFDTAPDYCAGNSEKIFGEAFKTMKRSDFYVSTKCGLWNATDADSCRRMVEQSLKNMNVDSIDIYNMWCILNLDQYHQFLKPNGILEGARKAQEEGLIKHISFTTHMSGEDIAKVAADGLYQGVTLGYNAVNFAYRMAGVKACHDANMAVVTMNPLGGGIIPTHPDYFSFIKDEADETISISALKFLIGQEAITVALPGISSLAELKENIKAVENVRTYTAQMIDKMSENLKQELNSLCTGCSYCDECPVDIDIPKLIDSYNSYILNKGDVKAVKDRLSYHWGVDGSTAKNCIKCGKCEKLCTQKLPIIERLGEIAKMY